jgi:hypothetical protein
MRNIKLVPDVLQTYERVASTKMSVVQTQLHLKNLSMHIMI